MLLKNFAMINVSNFNVTQQQTNNIELEPIFISVWTTNVNNICRYHFFWQADNKDYKGPCYQTIKANDFDPKRFEILFKYEDAKRDKIFITSDLNLNPIIKTVTIKNDPSAIETVISETIQTTLAELKTLYNKEYQYNITVKMEEFFPKDSTEYQTFNIYFFDIEKAKNSIKQYPSSIPFTFVGIMENLLPLAYLRKQAKYSSLNDCLCLYKDKERCIAFYMKNDETIFFQSTDKSFKNLFFNFTEKHNIDTHKIIVYRDREMQKEYNEHLPPYWVEIDNSYPLLSSAQLPFEI